MNTLIPNVWLPGQVNPGLSRHRSLGPVRLDILADLELQHGHHTAAEHLSRLAAEQRELREARV